LRSGPARRCETFALIAPLVRRLQSARSMFRHESLAAGAPCTQPRFVARISPRAATRACVSAATLLTAMALALPARAEGWMYEGNVGLGTGLEGGDAGTGSMHWQRARFRLVAGLDLRSEESDNEGFGVRAVAELEKRGSFGGELRYARFVSRGFGAYAGICGTAFPETLLGLNGGATVVIPLGRPALFIEPSFAALPFGSDVPDDSIVFWALLTVGVNVRL
jgi:hypothetical protein